VKPGDVVSVREGSRKVDVIVQSLAASGGRHVHAWLSINVEVMSVRLNALPLRTEIDTQVSEQLVVEFYAR
jgi:small subunit ribosomal protein S4